MIGRFLDRLLGARCSLCNERVFPRDIELHWLTEHAGDPR
jgi:hypothetical protein